MIEAYPEYYNQTTGDPAPSQEEVIEGAIRKTIGSETDFKKFLGEWRAAKGSDGARPGAGGASKGTSKGAAKGGAQRSEEGARS